ncbi:EamA family transporter [candidate division GN15 bacterium]|nr:EamA family transporter [candidate division GN15 bacterium]
MTAFVYVLLCLIWGSTWITIKIGLTAAPPLQTASLRFILAMLILTGIVMIKRYPYPKDLRTWLKVGYPGVWMYGLHYALIYFAQLHISSSLTAVLFASFPFWVAILSSFRLKEGRVRPLAWLGIAIGFVGVVLISYDQLKTSGDLFEGTLLALVATYAAAHGMILHKKFHAMDNIVVSASIQMLFGGVLVLIAAFLFEDWSEFTVSVESIGSIVYLAILGTIVAFLSYYWLLARIKAVTASMIAFITPLVAIFIGVLFFEESLSLPIVIGTVLILSGVVLTIRRRRTAVPDAPEASSAISS